MMQQMVFSDPVKLNAVRYSKKEAVSYKGKRFTYEAFNHRINQLAHALQEKGIKKGDKVSFMLFNCNEVYEIMFACSKIGAVYVPINSRFVGQEIKHIVDNSESVILIYDAQFGEEIRKIYRDVDSVQYFISVHAKDEIAPIVYEDWIADFPVTEPEPDEPILETDTVCFVYTGGTTGLPKGTVRSHRSMYMVLLLFSIEFAIGRNGKGLVVGPLYGAAAMSISLPNFYVGNPVHILESFHPVDVLEAIAEEKPTSTFLAPPMFDAIFSLTQDVRDSYDVSSMKTLISVGAPLLTRTKENVLSYFKEADLNEFYGASEHGGSTNLFPEYQKEKERSVGLPMLGMEVKIMNEDGEEAEPGEAGEVFVKGLTLCDEYYKNPEATQEAFKGEWLGLGDVGKQDEEGFFYLVDRKQDMILSGAINVYPAEIEEVLYKHPKVDEVAVIGIPHQKWGEAPIAIIVLKAGESITEEEIKEFCTGRMAKYKIPKAIDFVEALPRSLQGKVLKYQLRDNYLKQNQLT